MGFISFAQGHDVQRLYSLISKPKPYMARREGQHFQHCIPTKEFGVYVCFGRIHPCQR